MKNTIKAEQIENFTKVKIKLGLFLKTPKSEKGQSVRPTKTIDAKIEFHK